MEIGKQETGALNWQAMTPRERGYFVGTRVMGWTMRPDALNSWWLNGSRVASDHWSPTTCPRACTEVIEAMRAKGWAYMIGRPTGDYPHVCTFYIGKEQEVTATADTMPEAVALAALRAVGVEV